MKISIISAFLLLLGSSIVHFLKILWKRVSEENMCIFGRKGKSLKNILNLIRLGYKKMRTRRYEFKRVDGDGKELWV